MVRDFTSTELIRMQGAQDDHMMDTCVRYEYAQGSQDIVGWSYDMQRKHGVPAGAVKDTLRGIFGNDPAAMANAIYLAMIAASGVKDTYREMYEGVDCNFPN